MTTIVALLLQIAGFYFSYRAGKSKARLEMWKTIGRWYCEDCGVGVRHSRDGGCAVCRKIAQAVAAERARVIAWMNAVIVAAGGGISLSPREFKMLTMLEQSIESGDAPKEGPK